MTGRFDRCIAAACYDRWESSEALHEESAVAIWVHWHSRPFRRYTEYLNSFFGSRLIDPNNVPIDRNEGIWELPLS